MLFNSVEYIFLFLPLVVLVYFCLIGKASGTLGRAFLILASLLFYGWWNPIYILLILLSIAGNYLTSIWILKSGRRYVLALGVVFNLGLLGYFKYADFFIENINRLARFQIEPLNLILPLAISFFTFQQIAYLCDCYAEGTGRYRFFDYALFVTFFPQLIAGPIVHHKEMMPQFLAQANYRFISENFAKGLFVFGMGLFKKVVIADVFALWANTGFDSAIAPGLAEAWVTTLSYSFQLYYDFSGYADMAIGAALMFNIRLPVNFNSPYKASNIQDFWRRWHMTLSRWLRQYVYIPLGGNRRGKVNLYRNLFLTFLLGGVWHGAGWTFVLWGSVHGLAIVVHRLWQTSGFHLRAGAARTITFLFAHFAWVLFRAETLNDAVRILRGMLGLNGLASNLAFQLPSHVYWQMPQAVNATSALEPFILWFTAIFAGVAFFAPNSMQIIRHHLDYGGRFLYTVNWKSSLYFCLIFGLALLMLLTSDRSEFLYFNF